MHQANTEIFLLIKIDDLLANPEMEADSSDFSNNNQIRLLNILEINFFDFTIIID